MIFNQHDPMIDLIFIFSPIALYHLDSLLPPITMISMMVLFIIHSTIVLIYPSIYFKAINVQAIPSFLPMEDPQNQLSS